jgi:hypothetical protein
MALKAIAKALTRSEESVKQRAKEDGLKIAKRHLKRRPAYNPAAKRLPRHCYQSQSDGLQALCGSLSLLFATPSTGGPIGGPHVKE